MKKLFIFAAAALGAIMPAAAEGLTADQSIARALKSDGPMKARAVKPSAMKLAYTAEASEFYIFNRGEADGYLIASGDDCLRPVLAVADSGTFDAENIPDNLRAWLDFYKQEIAGAIKYGNDKDDTTDAETSIMEYYSQWKPIEPMLTTQWNQLWPYNDKTPMVGTNRTPTGCVATAMAQVVKHIGYYNGKGSNSYTPGGCKIPVSFNFADYKPDFSKMPDVINNNSSQEAIDAVSTLMYACGVAVNMNYNTSASGAGSPIPGLIKYFGYDEASVYIGRENYSTPSWEWMIYNQLEQGRPIYYAGSGSGGHAFVCDGYSSNGLFHFNWGWGGISDGYFVLSALDPQAQGAGGSYGGYSSGQNIGIFVKQGEPALTLPTPQKPVVTVYGSDLALPATSGSIDNFGLMWTIFNTPEGKGSNAEVGLSLLLKSVDGSVGDIFIEPQTYVSTAVREVKWNFSVDFSKVNVPAGVYNAYVAYAVKGYDGYWTAYESVGATRKKIDHWTLTVGANGRRTYALATVCNFTTNVYNMKVNDFYQNDYDNQLTFLLSNHDKADWNEKISVRVTDAAGKQVENKVLYMYVCAGQTTEVNVPLPIKQSGKFTATVYRDIYTDTPFDNASIDFEIKSGTRPFGGKGIEPSSTCQVGKWAGEGKKGEEFSTTIVSTTGVITGTTALMWSNYDIPVSPVTYSIAVTEHNLPYSVVAKQLVASDVKVPSSGWVKGHDFSFSPNVAPGLYSLVFIDTYGAPMSYGVDLIVTLEADGLQYRLADDGKTVALVGCTKIIDGALTIPSIVSSGETSYTVSTITSNAVTNQFSMTELTVPASITNIEYDAFRGCVALNKVNFLGLEPPFANSTIPFYGIRPGAEFYVSDAAYDNFAKVFNSNGHLYAELTSFDVPEAISLMAGHSAAFTPITNTPHYNPDLVKVTCVDFNVLQVEYDHNGRAILRGIAPGTATLSVSCPTFGVNKTVKVNVIEDVKVILDQSTLKLRIGETGQLKASLSSESSLPLTWKSSDPAIADVDANGLVTAKGIGSAVISVYVEGNETPATCTVVVRTNITGLKVDPDRLTLLLGQWSKIKAEITPADVTDIEIEWSTSNDKVAQVSKSGDVYAAGIGTCRIKVVAVDTGYSAQCIVTVTEQDGILELEITPEEDVEIYDLQGHRITKPTRHGLYIVNGRKVIL